MISLRPYRLEDLGAILQRGPAEAMAQVSGREAPGATWPSVTEQFRQMYGRALGTPQATLLVADWPRGMEGEGPAAHILLMPQANPFTAERELIMLDIYTAPALRGRGVGRILLQRAETYARSIGCASVVAQVALHNSASLNLFRGSGFQGERVVVGKRLV